MHAKGSTEGDFCNPVGRAYRMAEAAVDSALDWINPGAVADWIHPNKSTLYKYIEEGQFAKAAKSMKGLDKSTLCEELLRTCRGWNAVQLLVDKVSEEADNFHGQQSVQLLDEILGSVTGKECKESFERQQLFSYVLMRGKERLFCHLLLHPCFLDEAQIKTCLNIIATRGYFTAGEHLLKHLKEQEETQKGEKCEAYVLEGGFPNSPLFRAIQATKTVPNANFVAASFIGALEIHSFETWRSSDDQTMLHVLTHTQAREVLLQLPDIKPEAAKNLVDERDAWGRRPLEIAASVNDAPSVQHLLAMGADARLPSIYQVTPSQLTRQPFCCFPNPARDLLLEAEHGLFAIHRSIEALMPDEVRSRRQEGFLLSCFKGYFGAARQSIEAHGVYINTLNNEGNNALMLALEVPKSEEEILPFVEYLISKGINLTHVNKSDENALMFAVRRNFNVVADKILEACPTLNLEQTNNHNLTVSEIAKKSKNEGFEALLEKYKDGREKEQPVGQASVKFISKEELGEEEPKEDIESKKAIDIFPIVSREDRKRTAAYLNNYGDISELVDWLTGEHLQLLDKEVVLSKTFPWEKLEGNPEKLAAMLPIDPMDTLKTNNTEEILRNLHIDVVRLLIHDLSGQHLHHLSNSQIQNEQFPWEELAQHPEKVKEMFSTSHADKDKTKRMLKSLDPDVIHLLMKSGGLTSEEHGSYLSDMQRERK